MVCNSVRSPSIEADLQKQIVPVRPSFVFVVVTIVSRVSHFQAVNNQFD